MKYLTGKKKYGIIAIIIAVVLILASCSSDGEPTAVSEDKDTAAQQLLDLQKAHPTPRFTRSQLRQNLIEITTAQAETTATTSFFYNMGVDQPVHSCPSIGFPIPTTMQLTNPEQSVRMGHDGGGSHTLPLAEQTGVYTGDSTGTYVICVDAEGNGYAMYWEGFVQTVAGPAEFVDGQVKLIGPPSFDFTASSEALEDSGN